MIRPGRHGSGGESPLDPFVPHPDARERFAVTVRAPAEFVFRVATDFDMQSVAPVRALLWARARLLGSRPRPRPVHGLLAELEALGWGRLAFRPGELVVCGAVCRPWEPDVEFTPVPPQDFLEREGTGDVAIAWTLEAAPMGAESTLLSTETRVAATDDESRRRFRRYWRWARFGIVPLRWFLLPAIRRAAERDWARVLRSAS